MIATILLVVLGAALLLVGFVGCVLPVLPGPPIAWLALLAIAPLEGWRTLSTLELVGTGSLAAVATLLDFVVPAWGARRYGASRPGVWGSALGMLVGMIVFPPWGMFVGAAAGAVLGELLAGRRGSEAVRAAWGTLVGTMGGILVKLAACFVIAWVFVRGAIELLA